MSDIPASIFKYVTPARVDIIAHEKICFTPPDRFNDLLDVRPLVVPVTDRAYLRQIEKEAQEQFIRSLPPEKQPKNKKERKRLVREFGGGATAYIRGMAPELAKNWERELQSRISQHFGVLCFSEIKDEHLMWAHYADEHRGFVIEFLTANPSFQALGQLKKVDYLTHRPVYDPVKGAMGFWRQKEDRWQYEREWRIARELSSCEAKAVGNLTIYLCPLPRASIAAVYLGYRSDSKLETRIRDALRGTQAVLHKAYLESESGSLKFRALPDEHRAVELR